MGAAGHGQAGATDGGTRIFVLPTYAVEQVGNVRSTAALAATHGFRPVIVCNSAATAAALGDNPWAVSCQANLGYGGAANLAASCHDFESLVLCNDDLTFTEPAMASLAEAASAAAGPVLVGFLPEEDPRLHPHPGVLGVLARVSGLSGVTRRLAAVGAGRRDAALQARTDRVRELPAGIGFPFSCVIITRAAWELLGGFDPRFPLYFEDADMLERAFRTGHVTVAGMVAPCTHRRSATSRTVLDAILPLMAVGARNYLEIHRRRPTWAATGWVTAGLLLRAVFWLPFRPDRRTEGRAIVRSLQAVWSAGPVPMPPWS